jgi:hypothetical protein
MEIRADTHLMKLQRLQYMVLRTTGEFTRNTMITDTRNGFQIP